MGTADLGTVRAAVNEAALDSTHWPEALAGIAAAVGANGSSIFTIDPAMAPLAQDYGTATDSVREYMDRWCTADPWFGALVTRQVWLGPGVAEFGSAVVPIKQLHHTEFHCDFLRRYGIEHLITLKVASGSDGESPGTHLSLYRPATRRDFGAEERAVLQALWPAVRRAVEVHSLLAGARNSERTAQASLDALALPAWIVGSGAFICFQNRAAAQWLAGEGRVDGLRRAARDRHARCGGARRGARAGARRFVLRPGRGPARCGAYAPARAASRHAAACGAARRLAARHGAAAA